MSAMIVPKGWEIKRLGELVDIVGGGTPARDIEEYWKKGSIPWVTVKDLHQKLEISDSEERITEFGLKNSAANLISPQNIITPTRMSLGRFFINSVPITINQDLKALKPKKTIFPLFLLWNLLQYGTKLEALGTGTTVKGITLPDLKNLQLPVPSFPEQQKIATILSTLDRTIEATKKLINKEKMVKKGLMADLLTHGIDEQGRIRSPQTHTYVDSPLGGMIPEGWELLRLSDIGQVITGNTPSTEHEEYYGGIIPFIGPVDFRRQKYIDEAEKNVSELGSLQSRKIPKNTIMTVCIGSTIGKTAIAIKDSCTNQQINSLVCSNQFNSEYIFYTMSQYLQKQLDVEAGLQAVPIVNKSSFSKLLLPCPILAVEQQKIATILSAQDRKIETEETNLAKLRNLKKGLMGDLLRGDVRVKI